MVLFIQFTQKYSKWSSDQMFTSNIVVLFVQQKLTEKQKLETNFFPFF